MRELERVEAYRLLQPRWLPASLFRLVCEAKASRQLGRAVRAIDPAMAERLEGISEASGVPPRALWLIQAMEAMLGSVGACTRVPRAPLGGCSAVALRPDGGGPLLAHNFDYIAPVRPYFAIRETRPAKGYRSLDFLVAPLAGAIDGVNEAGLAISYNYAMTIDQGRPAPTLSMLVSGLLAGCSSVTQAIDWLSGRRRWGGGLLMLVDAQGGSASVEVTNTHIDVRHPEAGRSWLAHTNKLAGASTGSDEVSPAAVFDARAPAALRGTNVLESPKCRDARLQTLLTAAGRLDADGLARLLSDHGPDGVASINTVCMHSAYWTTSACLQLDPIARRLRASFSTACQAHYHEFALGSTVPPDPRAE
jgi:hypothetical protein